MSAPRSMWVFGGVLLAVSSVTRLILAASTDLAPDEAYYWTWSRSLSLSYLDHPPLLAWVLALVAPSPGATLAVRLVPLVAGVVTLILLWDTLRRENVSQPRAIAAVGLLSVTPFFLFGGVLATPDALLMPCWVLGLRQLLAIRSGASTSGTVFVLGLAVGLGLLAKLPMVLFVVAAGAGALRLEPAQRARVGVGLASGLLIALPVYVVALGNGDIVGFQFSHVSGSFSPSLVRPLEGLLGLVGLLSPWVAWQLRPRWCADFSLERALTVIPLGAVGLLMVLGRAELGWFLIAVPAAVVAGARALPDRLSAQGPVSTVIYGAVAALFVLGSVFVGPMFDGNPVTRVQGWRDWSEQARAELPAGPWVTSRYQEASQLRFYGDVPATTLEAVPSLRGCVPRKSQFGAAGNRAEHGPDVKVIATEQPGCDALRVLARKRAGRRPVLLLRHGDLRP